MLTPKSFNRFNSAFDSWFETVIKLMLVLIFAFVILSLTYGAYTRLTCHRGHEVRTQRLSCSGTEGHMTCEPETEFVCDDP